MSITSKYFKVSERKVTPSETYHRIAWEYYFSKSFLSNLSRHAVDLGWLQSGLYKIKQENKKTSVYVNERILREFAEVVGYLAKKYNN